METKRAVGLILTCLGTCTFVLLMDIVEVIRYMQGPLANYDRTLTSFPEWLYLFVSIAWIVVGVVLMIQGKSHQQAKGAEQGDDGSLVL